MASTRLSIPTRPPFHRDFPGVTSLLAHMARLKKPAPAASVPETSTDSAVVKEPQPEPPRGGIYGIAEKIFGIDVRSLALFRICLALLMIMDLLTRAVDLRAHYSDAGIQPIALTTVYQQRHWWWTFHNFHPAAPMQAALFLVAGIFALSLLVGYRTRTASVVCWALLVSLQNRNALILTGGDGMLRVLAFWAMFLPLGLRWSVDRALDNAYASPDKPRAPLPHRIFSVGTIALITQLGIVYLFGALLKTGATWHKDYSAVYYAFSLGQFATPLAKFLLHYPDLLKPMTFFAWNLEFLAPFLILASAFSGSLRTLTVLAYMGFHISLGLCLELGLFPTIGALAWLVLMPDWFWQKLFRLTARLQPPTFFSELGVKLRPDVLRPQTLSTQMPRAIQVFVGLMLVYVICWNVRMTNFRLFTPLFPVSWNWIGEVTRMDQSWELFAPDPLSTSAWLVVPAKLQDGSEVDLKTGVSPVSYAEPPNVAATYYDEKWRKYLMNLTDAPDQNQRLTYALYLTNLWNNAHPTNRVVTMRIVLVSSRILPNSRRDPPEQIELFKAGAKQP